ncbi:MAG: ATP-dependent DNA helicase RecG [Saccharofermentans sp.]|nr:ATP-dependent DNA helicase RecG [Saccharofermentans sp.]
MSTRITLNSPVTDLYGIGPEAAKKLARLEVSTIYDLISMLPRRYNDWSNISSIDSCEDGMPISFMATITSSPVQKGFKRQSPVAFFVSDGSGRIELSFFNSPYIVNKYQVGDRVFVHGIVSYYGMHPQIVNPFCEKALSIEDIRLVRPVYSLTAGITSNMLSKWIGTALKLVGDLLPDVIPPELAIKENLCSSKEAYQFVHFPESVTQAQLGRRRIAFEELILLGIGMKYFMQGKSSDEVAPVVIPPQGGLPESAAQRWKTVTSNLGFKLTGDQKKAIADIQHDLMKSTPMNRLVQGDVGSGKTAVAVLSMAMTAIMGKQAVLLAPTSVLAKQHYDSAKALLQGSGINVALLLGKTKASLKREIKENLLTNEASVIIGTHAVLSDDVKFNDLGLVIADEQHRFGVKQREKLLISRDGSDGINSVHNLVMTATPIPRTLAMVIYGDMATSVIREKPAGRKEIKTHFLPYTEGDDIYNVLIAKLRRGEQAYIVCPRIDDDSDGLDSDELLFEGFGEEIASTDMVSVKEMKRRLDERGISNEYETEVLYGSMKETTKLEVMERFLSGETKVLISTTVIEVGVNNPNATMMIIMNAERFGLSTLHQLRGRIGRGDKQSYCVLCSDAKTENALERMKLMCECSDGFDLAGKDLELRGPGDFFGTRQHGIPSLRAANLFTDAPLAKIACDEVNKVLAVGGDSANRLMNNIEKLFKLRFEDKMGKL